MRACRIIGGIFSLARVWDAISDPLVGRLSDMTVSSFGRRHLWVLGSALPMWAAIYAAFAPPVELSHTSLEIVWVTTAVLLYYTATTAFKVPYLSLGSEVTEGAACAWPHPSPRARRRCRTYVTAQC